MPSSLSDKVEVRHRLLLEKVSPRPAKVDLKNLEDGALKRAIGRAVELAFKAIGLTADELSGKIGKDAAQIARWIKGVENPQFAALWAYEPLRQPLVIELAKLAGPSVEIETVVRCRRLP